MYDMRGDIMMNESILRKALDEKRQELQKAQNEYNRYRFSKQISAFTDAISTGNGLINLIEVHDLSADDCRLLGRKIGEKLHPIYKNFESQISENQARRKRKNEARSARRSSKETMIVSTSTSGHLAQATQKEGAKPDVKSYITPPSDTAAKSSAMHPNSTSTTTPSGSGSISSNVDASAARVRQY